MFVSLSFHNYMYQHHKLASAATTTTNGANSDVGRYAAVPSLVVSPLPFDIDDGVGVGTDVGDGVGEPVGVGVRGAENSRDLKPTPHDTETISLVKESLSKVCVTAATIDKLASAGN